MQPPDTTYPSIHIMHYNELHHLRFHIMNLRYLTQHARPLGDDEEEERERSEREKSVRLIRLNLFKHHIHVHYVLRRSRGFEKSSQTLLLLPSFDL